MANEKKNTPERDKKAPPGRTRSSAPPAARRKKTGADDQRDAPAFRDRKPESPRSKRTSDDNDRSAAPNRERRPASFSPKTKRDAERDAERTASPIRERSTTKPAERSKSKASDTRKRPGALSGKKTETPGDKNLVFPREARRYINVYLGLGSNVGNRRAMIQSAINLISDQIGKVAKQSHLYETQPWGNRDQDNFLNQVIMINTMLDPRDLLKEVGFIEQELGRVRNDKEKWAPRTIDIDILFYGKRVVRDKGLEIPHPELQQRAFVLAPLMEIAPDLEHPILKLPIDELYMKCEDPSDVIMLDS